MANNEEILAPKSLTLPSIPVANQSTYTPTGQIGMSGATLVFFNGSNWLKVTAA